MTYLNRLMVALTLTAGLLIAPALANNKFAAVTVDARTGNILYDSDSNALRHPASLTKMMTVYILFQELKAGRLKLSSPLRVSARAAGMPPSKLGLKPGSSITVEQAIKALIIKSANDVAATVGENLGRTESDFAARMTRTARDIGMKRTVFRNASGLPNPQQVTTARDMATLGLRLMRDFPQYYPYFRSTSFTFHGRIVRGHNRLVGRFDGTDGIKTGYVNASGFNLVSSTKRGDKRVVGVVLGGKTAARRDAFMMSMISKTIPKARGGRTIAAIAGSGAGIIDPIQSLKVEPKRKKTVASIIGIQPSAPQIGVDEAAKLAAVAEDAAELQQGDGEGQPQVLESKIGNAAEAADPMQVASLQEDYSVRIGKFTSKKSAETALRKLKAANSEKLKGKKAYTLAIKKSGKTSYRLMVSGLDKKSAQESCGMAVAQGRTCEVLQPNG